MSFVTNTQSMKMSDDRAFVTPTLKERLLNFMEPAILFYLGVYCVHPKIPAALEGLRTNRQQSFSKPSLPLSSPAPQISSPSPKSAAKPSPTHGSPWVATTPVMALSRTSSPISPLPTAWCLTSGLATDGKWNTTPHRT